MSRLLPRVAAVLLTGWAAVACGWFTGYGDEIASARVEPGVPIELTVPVTAPRGGLVLWLEYDLAHQEPYRVEGPLEVRVGSEVLERWTVELDRDSNVQGRRGGTVLHAAKTGNERVGTARGLARLVNLPPLPEGQEAVVAGTVQPGRATEVRSLRLIVAD